MARDPATPQQQFEADVRMLKLLMSMDFGDHKFNRRVRHNLERVQSKLTADLYRGQETG